MKKIIILLLFLLINQFVVSQTIVLDPTFGTNGTLELPYERLTPNGGGYGHSILLNNGKILVLQGGQINGVTRSYLTRINSNGTIDTSFGDNGYVIFNYYTFYSFSIRIQDDNKIVIYGVANPVKLHRFLENGQPDLTFGTNGLVQVSGGFSAESYGPGGERQNLVLLPEGRILIRYKFEGSGNLGYKLKCFNYDGTPYTAFGTNSELFTTSSGSGFISEFLFNSIDNKIIGFRSEATGGFKVEKFNLDGSKDITFGTNGILTTPWPFPGFVTNSITQDENFKLLIQSNYFENSIYKMGQIRLDSNGVLDTSFGNGGIINDVGFPNTYLSAPVIYNSKYYYTGGLIDVNSYEFNNQIIVSTNNNGALNANFNTTGSYSDNADSLHFGRDILIQNDGKIIVIGSYKINNTTIKIFIKRYIDTSLTKENFNENKLVFVNPVTEKLTFESQKKVKSISIHNSYGQKVSNSNSAEISTSDLSKGIYFATILFDDATFEVKKIIKK